MARGRRDIGQIEYRLKERNLARITRRAGDRQRDFTTRNSEKVESHPSTLNSQRKEKEDPAGK